LSGNTIGDDGLASLKSTLKTYKKLTVDLLPP